MSAVISECGKYRYLLERRTNCPLRWVHPMLFIMLNPSTADAETDDPTIRRCLRFAESHACTRLTVVNLFALRATNPKELFLAEDPVGPENDWHLEEQINRHSTGIIVAAWGAHPAARQREKWFRVPGLQCFGLTKAGAPRHPLYLPAKATLKPFP